jgi:hypothetical protein
MDSTPLLMPGEILPVSSSFFIEVDKHIRFVDPKKYKSAEAGIDPMRYFITSGDAVQKIGIMIQHVRTAIRKNKNAYGKALQKMLKEATTLQKAFLKIRGPHCFLETEWDSHRLVCVPKDPRKRDDESQTASN